VATKELADLADPPAPPGLAVRTAVVVVAAYVGAQVVSDVASVKIGVVAGRAVDMGTFVYPVTFTLRDVVHKVLGRSGARTLVVTAAVVNLAMAAYLTWTAGIASDPGWGLGREYAAVLSPVWRITIASIVAEVVSELADTEAYHWFVTRVTTRWQWARVLVSNAISVPLDNVVFALGAFALTLPWATVWDIFAVNLVVKGLVTIASVPLIYLTADRSTTVPSRAAGRH
jgi:queuosine precursor transporter